MQKPVCQTSFFVTISYYFSAHFSYNLNMNATYEQIEKQARQLSLNEKGTLARVLIEDLESTVDPDVDDLWAAEAERRYRAYKNRTIAANDGDEVMARLRKQL